MKLHVLNHGASETNQWFHDGVPIPMQKGHPPIGSHAYAACTNGAFLRDYSDLPPPPQTVLLLLKAKQFAKSLKMLNELQGRGYRVFVAFYDVDAMQVSEAFTDWDRWGKFSELVQKADGFVAATPALLDTFHAAGAKNGTFIPAPYPIEFYEWDFSQPLTSREGVFVGTNTFSVFPRRHLQTLTVLARAGVPATVVNTEGKRGERLISAISKQFRIIEGPLPYVKYLRLMASHRVVFQLDFSAGRGLVAGDAALCRMPCVGGNGIIEQMIFPSLAGYGRSSNELLERLLSLLADDEAWRAATEESQRLALSKIGFKPVAQELVRCMGAA